MKSNEKIVCPYQKSAPSVARVREIFFSRKSSGMANTYYIYINMKFLQIFYRFE